MAKIETDDFKSGWAELTNTQWKDRYRKYLSSKQWQEKRFAALNRAGRQCEVCGVPWWKLNRQRPLEVHHLHYDSIGNEEQEDLKVLCQFCHEKADRQREDEVEEYRLERFYSACLSTWADNFYERFNREPTQDEEDEFLEYLDSERSY